MSYEVFWKRKGKPFPWRGFFFFWLGTSRVFLKFECSENFNEAHFVPSQKNVFKTVIVRIFEMPIEYWPGQAPPTSTLIRLVFLLHTKAFVEGLKVGSERTCWEL